MTMRWMHSGVAALLAFAPASLAMEPAGDYLVVRFIGDIDRPPSTLWLTTTNSERKSLREDPFSVFHIYVQVSVPQLTAARHYFRTVTCVGHARSIVSEYNVYVVKERVSGVEADVCVLPHESACRVAADMYAISLKDLAVELRSRLKDYQAGIRCQPGMK
jgi:hypothetical protein